MKRTLVPILGFLFPILSAAQLNLQRASIIPPSAYIEFSEPVNPGTGWLALKATAGVWELIPAKVQSRRVVVRNLGQVEDMELTSNRPDAVLLLRHKHLKAGTVEAPATTLASGPLRPRDGRVNISWHGQSYQLEENHLHVALVSGSNNTALGDLTYEGDDKIYSSLLWAGDLDRDGRLDVIVDFASNESGAVCLYLSSVATPGQLVGKVSCWYSSGG